MSASQTDTSHLRILWQEDGPARRGAPPAVPVSALGDDGAAKLHALREAARRARCERHLSLAEAHRCLGCPGPACAATEALVKTLSEVLGRRPSFHCPGTRFASFDEAWLVRCQAAQARGDVDSLALLVRRRVAPPLRRPFLDLLRAL